MTTLLAVDGNSLAHRAWHALLRSDLTGPFVTHGIVNMLASCWQHGPYDGVVVAFDTQENLRKQIYAQYKAGREKKDPELYVQMATAQQLLASAGLHVVSHEGYEADDLLASIAGNAHADLTVDMLSSDRDLTQHVAEHVRLLRPKRTMTELTVYTPQVVFDEYGVTPAQYLQFAALRGDTSDNLPGVVGVGPKKAAKLLADHGDIEGIYTAIDTIKGKQHEKLVEARDNVVRNLQLMAPMPIDVQMPDLAAGFDGQAAADALADAGLPAAGTALRLAVGRPPAPDFGQTILESPTGQLPPNFWMEEPPAA